MTLEELEAGLDALVNIPDEAERRAAGITLKLDMRKYKEERDEVENDHLARVEALENDVASRDETIAAIRESNSRLVDKMGKILIEQDMNDDKDKSIDVNNELDDLIKRFD